MYPSLLEVYLDPITVVDSLVGIFLFYRIKHLIYVDLWCEVDAVFGDAVVREGSSEFAYFASLLS